MRAARFEFDGRFEEKRGQQFLCGRGMHSDGYTNVRRLESHGFASVPPKGAQGLVISPNGNPDEAYLIGVEHHEKRPAGLPLGGTAIYDHNGNIIKLVGPDVVMDFKSHTINLSGGSWTITGTNITLVGPVQINGNLNVDGNITATGTITP